MTKSTPLVGSWLKDRGAHQLWAHRSGGGEDPPQGHRNRPKGRQNVVACEWQMGPCEW